MMVKEYIFAEKKQIKKNNNNRKGYFDDYHHRMNNMEVPRIIIPLNEVVGLDDMTAY
jgi:hypothetical protein